MKLVVLHSRLSDRGGADRWLLGLLAGLQAHMQTTLLVGRRDPKLPPAQAARVGPVQVLKGLDRSGLGGRGAQGAAQRLVQVLDTLRPDALLINDVVDPALLAIAAQTGRAIWMVQDHRSFCPGPGRTIPGRGRCTQPMGAQLCASCLPEDDYRGRMLALTEARRQALCQMSQVVALSGYMAGELVQAGADPGRVRVVPPWVDDLAFPPAGPPLHHLLAGRLDWLKGADLAYTAAARLQTALPLAVAGAGPIDVPAQSSVLPLGWLDRPEMAQALSQAHSLWLPSRWMEPFGIIGLEAMAAGVPPIAADVGGVRDWLSDGDNGLLVPPDDAPALAAAADRLVRDPHLRARLGAAGRDSVQTRFGRTRAIDAWCGLLSGQAERTLTKSSLEPPEPKG